MRPLISLIILIALAIISIFSTYYFVSKIVSNSQKQASSTFSFFSTFISTNYEILNVKTEIYKVVTLNNTNNYDLHNYQIRIKLVKASSGDKVFDFYDDFLTLENWYYESGKVAINNGVLQVRNASSCDLILISKKSFSYSKGGGFILEWREKYVSEYANSGWDLFIPHTDVTKNDRTETSGNYFLFAPYTSSGVSKIWRHSGTTWSNVASGLQGDTSGSWHIYRIVINPNFELYLYEDNKLLVSYTETSWTSLSGYLAWREGNHDIDWIRVRKYADQEPSVSVDESAKTITISNPNNYDLVDFQVRIPLNKAVFDIQYNGETVPFCFEHSNGECDANPIDVKAIWVKVPKIPANSQIVLHYIDFSFIKVVDSLGNLLNFCYEQTNGECNTNPSAIIWVKVPSIPANGEMVIYIETTDTNYAKNGDQVFDFYDDFSGTSLDSSKWDKQPCLTYTINNGILTITHGGASAYLGSDARDGYILEGRIRYYLTVSDHSGSLHFHSDSDGDGFIEGNNTDSDSVALFMRDGSTTILKTWIGSGTTSNYDITNGYPIYDTEDGVWYRLRQIVKQGYVGLFVFDDNWNLLAKAEFSVNFSKTMDRITIGHFSGGDIDIQKTDYDWVRVRKYANNSVLKKEYIDHVIIVTLINKGTSKILLRNILVSIYNFKNELVCSFYLKNQVNSFLPKDYINPNEVVEVIISPYLVGCNLIPNQQYSLQLNINGRIQRTEFFMR